MGSPASGAPVFGVTGEGGWRHLETRPQRSPIGLTRDSPPPATYCAIGVSKDGDPDSCLGASVRRWRLRSGSHRIRTSAPPVTATEPVPLCSSSGGSTKSTMPPPGGARSTWTEMLVGPNAALAENVSVLHAMPSAASRESCATPAASPPCSTLARQATLTAGGVGDVSSQSNDYPLEGQQVVFADGMHGDVLGQNNLIVAFAEDGF